MKPERIKTGKLYVEVYGVACPTCGEPCGAPSNGSHMFGPEEWEHGRQVVECSGCGARVRMPALPAKKAARP